MNLKKQQLRDTIRRASEELKAMEDAERKAFMAEMDAAFNLSIEEWEPSQAPDKNSAYAHGFRAGYAACYHKEHTP